MGEKDRQGADGMPLCTQTRATCCACLVDGTKVLIHWDGLVRYKALSLFRGREPAPRWTAARDGR